MTQETLDKINKFTRRELTEDEVYTFSVILCDNEIDRDCERFSDSALETLREKFIGKTGIFDHDPSTVNQTARIFDTELVTDSSRKTKTGKDYTYLKAQAYMVRTDENKDLIAEIDGGIKKEVSISCSASKKLCSVCGCDRSVSGCAHTRGKLYGGSVCHTILDGITDAYEWSFVAVPAQVNAGVTKHFCTYENVTGSASYDTPDTDAELRRDIRRLAYFAGGRAAADIASLSAMNMNTEQLAALRKSFSARRYKSGTEIQLMPEAEHGNDSDFSIR